MNISWVARLLLFHGHNHVDPTVFSVLRILYFYHLLWVLRISYRQKSLFGVDSEAKSRITKVRNPYLLHYYID